MCILLPLEPCYSPAPQAARAIEKDASPGRQVIQARRRPLPPDLPYPRRVRSIAAGESGPQFEPRAREQFGVTAAGERWSALRRFAAGMHANGRAEFRQGAHVEAAGSEFEIAGRNSSAHSKSPRQQSLSSPGRTTRFGRGPMLNHKSHPSCGRIASGLSVTSRVNRCFVIYLYLSRDNV